MSESPSREMTNRELLETLRKEVAELNTKVDKVLTITTTTGGFTRDEPVAEVPDFTKLYTNPMHAQSAADKANAADGSARYGTIQDTSSGDTRVWPMNPQGGWEIPSGWRRFYSPAPITPKNPSGFEPHDDSIHDLPPDDPSFTGVRPGQP